MSSGAWISWGAWLLVIILGSSLRSRTYGIFRAVTLGIHNLIALPILTQAGSFAPLLWILHALVFFESLALIRPRLRPTWYRVIVTWPALYMAASVLLAWPWAILLALGFEPWGLWAPFLLGSVGMFQSLTTKSETPHILVGRVEPTASLSRVPLAEAEAPLHMDHGRPLRIAQ